MSLRKSRFQLALQREIPFKRAAHNLDAKILCKQNLCNSLTIFKTILSIPKQAEDTDLMTKDFLEKSRRIMQAVESATAKFSE